jgi:hypothetical protein
MDYKKQELPNGTVVWYEKDGYRISFVDPSPGNTEYERYLEWLAAGGVPEVIEL